MDAPDRSGPADRQAYLEEQIQRQERGEAIDVAWVKAELERIRRQQAATLASTQRNLRWLVVGAATVLGILWIKNGGLMRGGGFVTLGLILIGLLTAWGLGRRRK
ncbi:MAG TPA: hypothetical protein VLC06_28185 [Polyangia bacterium]|nr:hypothetical protein [Polyangia bacterium]